MDFQKEAGRVKLLEAENQRMMLLLQYAKAGIDPPEF